ncbi:hypothetical protein E3N88_23888 [Mikania micrantha]|uniref:Uncharacterized protein n=1 Tax=Mikania micrantha TaxID=192012 RepID=A0A5N6NGL4_9ASTR|nr:hypothetical protein E3N88_23888 [Mikania micrantha]
MKSESTSKKKPMMMLARIIKTPMKALHKAKDIYIKGITSFNTTYNRPRMIIEDANRTTMLFYNHGPHHQVPKDLTRAGSFCTAELERDIRKRDPGLQTCVSRKGVHRSCSVVMGRIDEDRSYSIAPSFLDMSHTSSPKTTPPSTYSSTMEGPFLANTFLKDLTIINFPTTLKLFDQLSRLEDSN